MFFFFNEFERLHCFEAHIYIYIKILTYLVFDKYCSYCKFFVKNNGSFFVFFCPQLKLLFSTIFEVNVFFFFTVL